MTLLSRGRRTLVADGDTFVWTVRRKPTYAQVMALTPLTVAISRKSGGGLLHVSLDAHRPDNALEQPAAIVTPDMVRSWIVRALAAGWQPSARGTFRISAACATSDGSPRRLA